MSGSFRGTLFIGMPISFLSNNNVDDVPPTRRKNIISLCQNNGTKREHDGLSSRCRNRRRCCQSKSWLMKSPPTASNGPILATMMMKLLVILQVVRWLGGEPVATTTTTSSVPIHFPFRMVEATVPATSKLNAKSNWNARTGSSTQEMASRNHDNQQQFSSRFPVKLRRRHDDYHRRLNDENVTIEDDISEETVDGNDEEETEEIESYYTGTPFDYGLIPPAQTISESVEWFDARRQLALQWFSPDSVPPNKASTSSLPQEQQQSQEVTLPTTCRDEDNDNTTNCFLDSRSDTRRFCDWTVVNIIYGQAVKVQKAEQLILDSSTKPFAATGSSVNKNDPEAFCHRYGDYNFALMNFLHLAYISRSHTIKQAQNTDDSTSLVTLSKEAYRKVITFLLTLSGNDHDVYFQLSCGSTQALKYDNVRVEDTENHILMEEVAQYLTNQLLAELAENNNNTLYDNIANGNQEYMLNYLSNFFRDFFYEYNSRPYQAYTVLAVTLLAEYAQDGPVALAAEMLLEVITAWTAIQSNQLRRFVPFRRQPKYFVPEEIEETQGWKSWSGDGEAERLSLLAGNYGYLKDLDWIIPPGDGQRHFILYAATSSYRMNDILLDFAIHNETTTATSTDRSSSIAPSPHLFVASHDTVEIYHSMSRYQLSAGGIYRDATALRIDRVPKWMESLVTSSITSSDHSAGWARSTTLVPTKESSSDIRDMIQFEGHVDVAQRSNTCVGPGFACGLSPNVGNKLGPLKRQCSREIDQDDDTTSRKGNWTFFDLTSSSADCPLDYGLYVAMYERTCETSRCTSSSITGTFGLLEVIEASPSSLSLDEFASAVISNNPSDFTSDGVQTYTTTAGDVVEFEVFPSARELSSLVSINGEQFGREPHLWPLIRGNIAHSSSPGRFTFDSPSVGKRLILDMTAPQRPQRLYVDLPVLKKSPELGKSVESGRYFDDGSAVVPGVGISFVEIAFSGGTLLSLKVGWRNTLTSTHGQTNAKASKKIELAEGEYITQVSFGTSDVGGGISFFRLRTSLGREMKQSGLLSSSADRTFSVIDEQEIVAFHGHATESKILGLGVVYTGPEIRSFAYRMTTAGIFSFGNLFCLLVLVILFWL